MTNYVYSIVYSGLPKRESWKNLEFQIQLKNLVNLEFEKLKKKKKLWIETSENSEILIIFIYIVMRFLFDTKFVIYIFVFVLNT